MKVYLDLFLVHHGGTGYRRTLEIEASSTADGICMALDRLEAEGYPIDRIPHLALVAKAHPSGAYIVAHDPMSVQEAMTC